MFNKQDLGKHIPDGKSAKDDFARMFIVSSYQCSIWGAGKDWWAYQIRVSVGYTKLVKRPLSASCRFVFQELSEQNKQPLWVLPDMDESKPGVCKDAQFLN